MMKKLPSSRRGRSQADGRGRPARSSGSWTVPWQGGTALLTVEPALKKRHASVRLDGREVATFARPTRKDPWAECSLPGSEPPILVVQMAYPHATFDTDVLVDGTSLAGGLTETQLRAQGPEPLDAFEREFGTSRLFGPPGAVGLGAFVGLSVLSRRDSSHVAVGVAIATFFFVVSWVLVNGYFIQWLVDQRSWPSAARRLLVAFTFLGLPLVATLVLLSLAPLV